MHLQDLTTWGEELHINMSEMRVVQLTLNAFHPRILEESVVLMNDSITVVDYLRKQGGIVSRVMCSLAQDCSLIRTTLGDFVHKIYSWEEHPSKPVKGTGRSEGVLFYLQSSEHEFIIRD